MTPPALLRRLLTPEVLTFLGVGGAGFVVDVAVFNWLRGTGPFATWDPAVARTVAVCAAVVVTYAGNRTFTWRDAAGPDRRREIALFGLFSVIGYCFSLVCLLVSHDLLGLTGRLADNVSANGVGLALGTVFRFLTYKRWVFRGRPEEQPEPERAGAHP